MVQTVTGNGVATSDGVGLEFVAEVCLIGAGAAGLAAGKALADRGIAFDWFEKGSMVGGLWRIDNDNGGAAAYKTLHLNSSRPLTQYPSYPMPEDWPDYPPHEMIATYFQSFAEDNHLLERITFRTEVTSVEPLPGDGPAGGHGWAVTVAGGQRRTYRNVMVANGHHGAPNIPDFPGEFTGADAARPRLPRPGHVHRPGRRGGRGGNSGMDIACDAAKVAHRVYLVTRHGVHVIPKYAFGKPVDQLGNPLMGYIPFPVERTLYETIMRLSTGRPEDRGLPKPDHRLLHAHPTVSAELYDRVGHGDITMKPGIEALDGDQIRFDDDSVVHADILVYATGYRITLPFLAPDVYDPAHNAMPLYQRVVSPDRPGLFFIGFIQTVGANIPLYEYQSQWIGDVLTGDAVLPSPDEMRDVDRQGPEVDGQALPALRPAHHAGRLLALHPRHEGGPGPQVPPLPHQPGDRTAGGPAMKALLADVSTQRYLLTAAAQKMPAGRGRNAGWGPGGILRLVDDHPVPALPAAPGWVRLRPELSGICGSDLALLHAKISLVLTAFGAAPRMILGHEMVAVVEHVGPGVTTVAEGDRVAVNPIISCAQRGYDPPCRACADGYPGVCERFDEPGVSGCSSMSLGLDATVGGGWGEQVVAHESQVFDVAGIPSHRAVLAEPASITLHAALRWDRRGDRVVVIGAGTIGLLTTAALRMLHPDLDIIMLSVGDFGTAKALEAGATRVLPSGPEAVELLAASDGGRILRPRMTRTPILEQGVDAVFDCVASPADDRPGTSPAAFDRHLRADRRGRKAARRLVPGVEPKDHARRHLQLRARTGPRRPAHHGTGRRMARRRQVPGRWPGHRNLRPRRVEDGTRDSLAGPRASCIKATLRPNPSIPLVGP